MTPITNAPETIEVSVTHEIKIDGEKSWVGTRYVAQIKDGETAEQAHERVDAEVQDMVMKSIHSTVQKIMEAAE